MGARVLLGVPDRAVGHRGREAAARAVLQVFLVQHRALDVPRQGDGVRADEDATAAVLWNFAVEIVPRHMVEPKMARILFMCMGSL